jgi:hypothetical protein
MFVPRFVASNPLSAHLIIIIINNYLIKKDNI